MANVISKFKATWKGLIIMISVCLATYNGQLTIKRQLDSILPQLTSADEIVLVDDCSNDATISIVEQTLANFSGHSQVIISQVNQGPIRSFEIALQAAKGDYIFLSDQDDIWLDDKVVQVMDAFDRGAQLVVHDGIVVDGHEQTIDCSWNHYNHNQVPQSLLGNIIKNGFTGAMMAFTKKVKAASLPFPKMIVMHDQWLFQVSKLKHYQIINIDKPLMKYVRHGNNVTGMHKRKKSQQIKDRINMVKCLLYINRK